MNWHTKEGSKTDGVGQAKGTNKDMHFQDIRDSLVVRFVVSLFYFVVAHGTVVTFGQEYFEVISQDIWLRYGLSIVLWRVMIYVKDVMVAEKRRGERHGL